MCDALQNSTKSEEKTVGNKRGLRYNKHQKAAAIVSDGVILCDEAIAIHLR